MLDPYVRTQYINNQAPALNQTNLNNNELGTLNVTNEAIALGSRVTDIETPSDTVYIPQAIDPSPHTEGTLFYSESTKSLSYYNDISDMTLNIGQETVVRIYNDTGATIVNGAVLRAGLASVNGVPTVVLALADNLANGYAGAVATHTIPDQTEGFATLSGSVSGVDTSAFSIGDRLYLSDTVPGGYTTPPPEVASYIGLVLVSDATNGVILVNPNSLINLPTLSGYMQTLATPTVTVTATPQKFANYAIEDGIIMHGDPVSGLFTTLYRGGYEAKTQVVVRDITGAQNSQSLDLYLRINEGAVGERLFPLIVGRNGEEASGSPFFEINLELGDTVSLWYASNDINEDVTIESITFSLTSINVR